MRQITRFSRATLFGSTFVSPRSGPVLAAPKTRQGASRLLMAGGLALVALGLSGCDREDARDVPTAVNVIDESGLNDVMLNATDPSEAVAHFARASLAAPDRIDLARGLGFALVRAKDYPGAVKAFQRVIALPGATDADKVELADAMIRNGDWKDAETVLNTVPPTFETFKRYRLEAMIADSHKDWKKADSFYEIATGLTTTPAGVLNNWGFSKLSRGDYKAAEKLFTEAVTYEPSLFTAKNNLVLARGAQGIYDLPVIPMTQVERAQLLHTLGLSAVKRGDITIGKGLFAEAIQSHPQHFEAAVRSLRALEANVTN